MLGDDKKPRTNISTNIQKTKIDLSLIELNSKQPRKTFDDDKLLELSNSIKNIGQIVPIIVRESPKSKNKYVVVAGERRWRASKLAGLKTIDVVFSDKNEKLSSLASIIENVQREDLNSMEEAEAYNSLINEYNLTHEEISKFTGKSRSYISNFIRIVGLPDDVKQFLIERKISFGHARALLSAKNISKMANIVTKHQLNVRQTEALIKEEQKEISKKEILSMSFMHIRDIQYLYDDKVFENWGQEAINESTEVLEKIAEFLMKKNITLDILYIEEARLILEEPEASKKFYLINNLKNIEKFNNVRFNFINQYHEDYNDKFNAYKSLFFIGDIHWNDNGNKKVADEILKKINF